MEGMALVVMAVMSAGPGDTGPWADAAEAFALGPVAPRVDLRNMLTRYVVQRSCVLLDSTAERRRTAIASGNWRSWRDALRRAVLDALGPMPFGEAGPPLNVRSVSQHEREGYHIENVLFESLPGLDVNGSVYLPLEAAFPPPWPAIIVPVGHSAKTRESYQKPAQIFARMGYVAITFDPPDMAGEKPEGNDHFVDGVRCYLTGHSSNRYFVIDALRCIDYLASRPDVDMRRGVGMTGVSGGGITTMYAAVLDGRIAAAGPACCAVPKALHPVLDTYAECPEPMAIGRFAQYDDVDILAAAMPTPLLLMAGAGDEVFTKAMSERIAAEVGESFQAAGFNDRFSFFLDPGGHAYSVAMAMTFAKWMDRWVRGTPDRQRPEIPESALEMLPDDMLACHPRQDRNIYTVNRDMALALRGARSGKAIPDAVREVVHIDETAAVPEARLGAPARVWFHFLQELMLKPEPGIELPATYLYPAKDGWRGGAVLYFDDRGRWTDLRTHGPLARTSHFIEEGSDGPAVMSADLRGWGDSRPADLRYDMAGWGCRARWLAYVSAALGDPVLAMRIRDGLSALAYLRSREEIDPKRIVVGGRGMGGVVALHVAAVDAAVAGVFCLEGLASFESLATSRSYAWSPEAFFPNVLKHYDLPELTAALAIPTLIANPLGPNKEALNQEDAESLYAAARKRGDSFELRTGAGDNAVRDFIQGAVSK